MFQHILKSTIRVLLKNRGYAISVIFTFAISIGVNAAIYSFRDGVLERTISVDEVEDLVGIYAIVRGEAANGQYTLEDYHYSKEHLKGVSELAAHYSTSPIIMSTDNKYMQFTGAAVSANFFSLLRLRP